MKSIITSRWETDAYKLSMGQVFWQRFPNVRARYEFVDRNNTVYPRSFAEILQEEINLMANLPSNAYQADYLKKMWPFINSDFLDWYTFSFRHNPEQVRISQKEGKLSIIVEGPIAETTHWEIPILRIVSCLYTKMMGRIPRHNWRQQAADRAKLFYEKGVAWSEFGGRRPFSDEVHLNALAASSDYKQPRKGMGGLIGTSWIEFAYQLDLMPIGTQAHEFTSFMGGYYGHESANEMALSTWIETYGTRLGYVLPDTYTTPEFLKIFGHGYADLFEGSRQDSGDPYIYAHRMVGHYRKVDVDSSTKSIIHSNSLRTEDDVLHLNTYLSGEYLRSFGLGGMITNNVGHPPYNTIIKLFGIWLGDTFIPTVKIPDNPEKAVGDPATVAEVVKRMNLHQ